MMHGYDLAAKIKIPKILHKILSRNDIGKTIDAAVPDKAICIVAPYGSGKTLAVISWLLDRGRRAVWLNLDESDNAEPVLLDYLTAAVLSVVLERPHVDDFRTDALYERNPRAFLMDAALLPAREGNEKILILDNFRHIRDIVLQRFIRDFIAACLGEWEIILISREELPPAFNDLILKGHICLITLKDLNFSFAEIMEYFSINEREVSRQDVLRLREDTEGWPAALNVVLAVSRDGPVVYGESARDYVRGFFETEIWDDLEENIRDFLLKTSILELLTPSACHAVTDVGATLPIMRWLYQNGLFISKLSERDTYCYHRVFRDFLLDALKVSDIDEKVLCKKYAWWLFEKNKFEQSFFYFFKAHDLSGVRQALKTLNIADMGIEGFLERVGSITQLDASKLTLYPEIVAVMALVHYLKGDVSKMLSLYHSLLEWDESGMLLISPEEYAEYKWEAGWLCYLNPNENPTDGKHLEHSNYRYYVPHLKQWHISRMAILSFPSYFRGIRDYGTDDIFHFESYLDGVEKGEEHFLDEEEMLWSTYLISAEYEYELEHFTKAEELVRRVMPLAEDRRYTYLYFICTALLVKLARAVRGPGETDALIMRLETMIMNNGHCFLLPNFHAFEQRNRLASGKPGFTKSFMDENREYTDKPYIFLLYRHITFVRGLLSTNGYSEAIIMLGNLDLMCSKYKRPTDLIEVNVLSSIAFYKLGNEEGACRHLTKAIKSAKKYGYIRIFSDDARDIWPILELVRKQMNDKYTKRIYISCKKALTLAGHKMPAKKPQYTELTRTELKILKSLQTGISYEEIAFDNNIRISTVKSHAHSIYSKLDVSNRTAAVMEAQRLGLLE